MGFSNIATFLASGNICFDSSLKSAEEIRQTIEKGIKKSFGLEIQTMARSLEDLKRLAARAPFFDYLVPDDIRFYVSFLGSPNSTSLEIPFKSPGGGLEIPLVIEGEVFSMVRLSKGYGTLDAMDFLEKEFGRVITTRNWNTIEKILAGK